VVSIPGDAAVQEQAQPVVLVVAEAVSDALDFLDDQVDGLGRSVADAGVVEAGDQFIPPGVEGAGQAGQLGDTGVGAMGQQAVEQLLGAGVVRRPVEQAQVLGCDPPRGDLPGRAAALELREGLRPGNHGR